MKTFGSFVFVLVLVFTYLGSTRAIGCKSNMNNPDKVAYTITVDLSAGLGNFTKIQDAINSIPSGNSEWIMISVNPGVYREQVKIPREKTCIILRGKNRRKTSIEWDSHGSSTGRATFTNEAENFVAKAINFKNTYNFKPVVDRPPTAWAVAVEITGDKSAFYNCGFFGVQDTLFDRLGRHYFESCYIEGAVDFIWGKGQSLYKNCKITVLGNAVDPGMLPGYITAQARNSTEDPSGFIFSQGTIDGSGSALLGRAYGDYARVIFDRVIMSKVIVPEGWSNFWKHDVEKVVYAESNCEGPGSNTSRRVSWEKKLSPEEVQRFTDISFIDAPEGWLLKQP